MQDMVMYDTSKNEGPRRLLLISMPFALSYTPSIQLGTLCTYLKSKGISVDVHHAYLKCADILSHELYHILSNFRGDELFYSSLLFPDNLKKHRHRIEKNCNKRIKDFTDEKPVPFQTILDKIRSFNEDLLTTIDFSHYALIGFSVTNDQMGPSIYLAREIKRRHPHTPIVFGGGRCADDLGISLLKTFSEIDFVVSGEGEKTLTSLFLNLNNKRFDEIKGLIWRDNKSVKFNGPPEKLPSESFLIPEYEDYFTQLEVCSQKFINLIRHYITIPVEGSRGCWWNKCTFCNLNMQYSGYREKSVEMILHEVSNQVDKYQYHTIKFVDNIQRIKDFDTLMIGLKDLKKDLNIFLEIRAARLSKEDFRLMQSAGVKTVQIGIEAFGNGMLQKMNKGVTVIENIASLKHCQEFGIIPSYNMIVNYPNETKRDLEETTENVKFLTNFYPPSGINNMILGHKSKVYSNARDFNIKEITIPRKTFRFFPKRVWQTLLPLEYHYSRITDSENEPSAWQEIFKEWKHVWGKSMSTPLLYYQDSADFLTITDNASNNSSKCKLKGIEREIYLFCDVIQKKETILKQFPDLAPDQLEEIVTRWITHRWMFREEDTFLSLAIRLHSGMSPLTYLSQQEPYTDKLLARWKLPAEKPQLSLRLGSIATLNFSLVPNKAPAWLKLLRKR